MVLIQPDDLDSYINEKFVKYIVIGEHICAIDMTKLLVSLKSRNSHQGRLVLKQDFIDTLPPATRSVDHVSEDFIRKMPIVMFESATKDGIYHRFDGRHRILWAWDKGVRSVDAVWVPRIHWTKFIIGYRLAKKYRMHCEDEEVLCEELPYMWDRNPLVASGPDRHLEKDFDILKTDFWTFK